MENADERSMNIDEQRAIEAHQHAGIREWVAEHLGGEVTEITRLERWRPQWKVCYRAGDSKATVLVRGDRPIAGKHDLRFEMEVMEVLEAHGIAVPHIHGWMESPKAFVMDWVETEDRAPGMLHTAIDAPTDMDAERWQAMLAYMGHLARVHAIPVSAFSHIRRLSTPPETPTEIALHATERMYRAGLHMGKIDTAFEFLQVWLRRNVPEHRSQANFIAGDAGQFMSAGSEVLALLDFEIADIGDTHWDLACFRGRHPYENMGDIPALYREYERVSGTPVDLAVVGYYTVAFLQLSGIAATFFMTPDAHGGNWIEGVLEYASITRRALEAIAELQDIPLDDDLHLPEPSGHPLEESGLQKLIVDTGRLPTSSVFEPWERDLLQAIPKFLLNHSRYRGWFERETSEDIARLLNRRFDTLADADRALTGLINESGATMDTALVQLLHRRLLRFSMIVAGSDPDRSNPLFHKLDPILPRNER